MTLEQNQRVRVIGVHRLRGIVRDVMPDGGAAYVMFDDSKTKALYLAAELEPDTPCTCAWCS
jgi:hypothetical protein